MKNAIAHLTPEAIEKAFAGTNFGRTDFEVILAETVLERAAGYNPGHRATSIATRLGLLGDKTGNVTKAGHEWAMKIFYSHHKQSKQPYEQPEQEIFTCERCGRKTSHPEGWHYCGA
ncbi:hypothetical protein KOEU_37120 [Komagataeibacter europaeus]|uniref:Uncharacterized protein n=1 Tax=Komagataeibacter europaeus TaxID=33995 RepID=A0A0M0EC04_KOMEU|nr:hypothetical protein [Komagataeibacter europaeus]KON62794.1 hypothetical protein KOEU_37120 [Komagataeibacter europaeus]